MGRDPSLDSYPQGKPSRSGGGSLPWLLQGLVGGLWGVPGWCQGLNARLSPQAAARHQCSYLVGLHMEEFLRVGGNPAWLQGLHYAPQKLRNLNEINKLLAHRPWLITKEHIEVRADAAGADPPHKTTLDLGGLTPGTPSLLAQAPHPPGLTLSGLRESPIQRAGSALLPMDGEGMGKG